MQDKEENLDNEVKELTQQEIEERLNIIQKLEEKLRSKEVQIDGKVLSITYKEDFELLPKDENNFEFLADVCVVKVEKDKVVHYEIFTRENELIAYVNPDGEIVIADEFLEKLDINTKKLLNIEDRAKVVIDLENKKKEDDVEIEYEDEKEDRKDDEEALETKEEKQDGAKEEIEEDLGIQNGDLAFEADIKDNRFQYIVPEAKDYEGRIKFCRVKGSNEVMMIGKSKDTGKFEELDFIKKAERTNERPVKISEDGTEVERENIRGIMKYNDKYSFGYNIDTYGDLKLELLREDNTMEVGHRYISSGIETRTQYPVTEQVKEMMDHTKNVRVGEEIKRYEGIKQDDPTKDVKVTDISDESNEGIIRLSNGETTTFEIEAQKAKVSISEFIRVYKNAEGKTPEEKIQEAHNEIEDEYRKSNRR